VAVEVFGYPKTLLVDTLFGLVSLSLLPLMKRAPEGRIAPASAAAGRARLMAGALGGVMVVWILHRSFASQDGRLAPLWGTFFTIALVISGMFLIGSAGVIGNRVLARLSMVAGILTVLVHAFRFHAETIGGWLGLDPAGAWGRFSYAYILAAPAFAAIVLFSIAAGADLLVSLPEPEATGETPAPEAAS
jgi:hypothetical protein